MTVTLPGRPFASAWLNTSLASGTDEERPALCKTVLVEFYPDDTIQLAATDSYLLLTTLVDDGTGLPPEPDELPDDKVVALDHDGRMRNLMAWLLKDAIRAEKGGHEQPTVTLEVRTAEEPDVPTLGGALDRRVLVVQTERERLSLDLYEGEFPTWRTLLYGRGPVKETGIIAFAPDMLARLGKLKETAGMPIELSLSGSECPVGLLVRSEPVVQGIVMPVRIS